MKAVKEGDIVILQDGRSCKIVRKISSKYFYGKIDLDSNPILICEEDISHILSSF